MERERPGSAGPSPSCPKSTDCGVRPANMTSKNGDNAAELGVKYRLEKVRWTRPSTWPSKLRLGTPADSTKQ
eukprot:3800142-Amphidinium_carterae.1